MKVIKTRFSYLGIEIIFMRKVIIALSFIYSMEIPFFKNFPANPQSISVLPTQPSCAVRS